MALQTLATVGDAFGYGFDAVTESNMMRASAFVHAEAGPGLKAATAARTIIASGPLIALPGPVVSITTVTDEDAVAITSDDWQLSPGGLLQIMSSANATGIWSVVYSQGAVPDGVVFLVCSVAARLAATPTGLANGAQQEGGGPFQVTYGMDAWKGQSGLTAGERAQLRRLLPRMPKLIVMGGS